MTRIAAIVLLAITVLAVVFTATRYREPQLQGSDEVNYVNLRPLTLQPGQSVTQPVDTQGPGLSRISFLYSFHGEEREVVHVMIRSAGRILADQDIAVPESLPDQASASWWIASRWDTEARFQPVSVGGPVDGPVVVTIAVPHSSQPLALWWSPPEQTQPHVVFGPQSDEDPGKRIAIRTEYGPVRPTITKLPTLAARVARYGAPWLPAAGLWVLVALVVVVTGGLVWLIASDPGPEAGPGGGI